MAQSARSPPNKHRLHLEAISGLWQQALIIDVEAKILTDNITSLMCAAAAEQANLPARSRKCNQSYAAGLMQRLLPRLVMFVGDAVSLLDLALALRITSSPILHVHTRDES